MISGFCEKLMRLLGIAMAFSLFITRADAETIGATNLADSFRKQLAMCWNPPPIGTPAEDSIVDLDIFLNQDGSVAGLPQLTAESQARAENNTYAYAAARAARRAILSCAPYKLPASEYNRWRAIIIHFDPRQMMGQ